MTIPKARIARATGKSPRRTEADRTLAAAVAPKDIEAARALWRRFAPDGYAGLIDAKIVRRDP